MVLHLMVLMFQNIWSGLFWVLNKISVKNRLMKQQGKGFLLENWSSPWKARILLLCAEEVFADKAQQWIGSETSEDPIC